MRYWLAWNSPIWIRRFLCKLGFHYWRHNTLYLGMCAGMWIRYCNDCGIWQERSGPKLEWKNKK